MKREGGVLVLVLLGVAVGALVGAATRDIPSGVLVGAGFTAGLVFGLMR